jgi:hypothetical protein
MEKIPIPALNQDMLSEEEKTSLIHVSGKRPSRRFFSRILALVNAAAISIPFPFQ